MSELVREGIGDFKLSDALSVEETVALIKAHNENLS
jgi:hypothetical protein